MRKMVRGLSVFSIVVALAAVALGAGTVNVITSFDKRTVDINDEIKMTIKVIGDVGNLERPQVPEFPGFTTHYTGRSSSFSFVAGASVQTLEFKFILVPSSVGEFTIDSFTVPIGKVLYRTEPIKIKVISLTGAQTRTASPGVPSVPPVPTSATFTTSPVAPATTTPQTITASPSSSSTQASTATTAPDASTTEARGADDNLFIQVTADKAQVYPNEQITLTYTLYTCVDVRYEGFEEEPETLGFWLEDMPDKDLLARDEIYLRGRPYIKAEVRKVALFPTQSGTFTLRPGSLKCTVKSQGRTSDVVDSFFNNSFFGNTLVTKQEPRVLATQPVTITVLPFPDANKPAAFSGISGDFRMRVVLDKTTVKQNEPVTMKITIEGRGNIATLERPAVPEDQAFRVYDREATKIIRKDNGVIQGSKTFEVVFVPVKGGAQTIPAVTFDYFHLLYKKYMNLSNGPFALNVIPSEEKVSLSALASSGAVPSELKESVTEEGKDIHYIKESMERYGTKLERLKRALIGLDGLLLIAALVLMVIRRHQTALDRDVVRKRTLLAFGKMKGRTKQLRTWGNARDVRVFEEAARVLDEYIADKINASPLGLTWDQIEASLVRAAIDEATVKRCRDFYETCNMARFAPATIDDRQYKDIAAQVIALADALERSFAS